MSRRDHHGPGWDPTIVRTLVEAYQRFLRVLDEMRLETSEVGELLSIASAADEMQAKLDHWQRRMDAIETDARLQAHRQRHQQQQQQRIAPAVTS